MSDKWEKCFVDFIEPHSLRAKKLGMQNWGNRDFAKKQEIFFSMKNEPESDSDQSA